MSSRKRPAPPAPPPTPAEVLEEFVCYDLQHGIARGDKDVAEFAAKIVEDHSRLGWGGDIFRMAARTLVRREILAAVTHQRANGNAPAEILTHLAGYARDQALRAARFPQRSTSVTSNLMAEEQGAAWADLVETLDAYAKRATAAVRV